MELLEGKIWRIKNQIFPSNSYVLKSELNDWGLIIDPGLDVEAIHNLIKEINVKPIAVLATHGHFDHIGSAAFFKREYDIPYYLHEADLKLSKSANFYVKMAGISARIETPIPDVLFHGNSERMTIGNFPIQVYNLPGHSSGSCIIQVDKFLFSGDILYKKGLGFNNFPGEDKIRLKESIKKIFETFSADSLILPGHGDHETLGEIKRTNQELNNFLSN